MTLYEISDAILRAMEEGTDPETGEISDELNGILDELEMARTEKRENIALYIKDLKAESDAITREIRALESRRYTKDRRAEWLESYLKDDLGGEPMETARVKVTYTKSTATVVTGDFVEWAQKHNRDDLLDYKPPTARKAEIKKAIQNGEKIEGAFLLERRNIQIK